MGNLFGCEPLNSIGYVVLLGFFIGMTILFGVVGAFLQYFGHVSDIINVKSGPFILTVVSLYLMFMSLLVNSYLSPCGGNLIMFVLLGIQIYILYAILNKKWHITDEAPANYSQV
ncbi:hypothetical protein Klosneuvirus_6_112 [Klosneuvirus KNV1]|uniref:Uncharacterized protein n=1 Tax=Klosneuvirus KNV1 TaxID=1977640 RepID=A0A1V0SLE7_9VIRU|nr:hypothetical protein Klosneuvirus_6_112 [Klosneuvirus KNV1]